MPLAAVGCDSSLNIVALRSEKIHFEKQGNFVVYFSNEENCVKLSDLVNNTTKSFHFGYKSNVEDNSIKDSVSCLHLNPYQSHGKI